MNPRVVLDPGVVVSALLVGGSPPARVLDAWRGRRFELVVSDLLLDEVREVLSRPKFRDRITAEQARAVLALLAARGRHPDPTAAPGLTVDPGDDYLAALALAAAATHLVTGDKGLPAWETDRLVVTTARRFLEELDGQSSRPDPPATDE